MTGLLIVGLLIQGCTALVLEPYAYIEPLSMTSISQPMEIATTPETQVPDSVYQGDIFVLSVPSQADGIEASFNGKTIQMARKNGVFYGLMPVSYSAKPTEATLILTSYENGTKREISYTISLLKKDFEEQNLIVSQSMQSVRSQDNLNQDAQKVVASKQERLTYPLWKESFIEPVDTYRLSTSYGLIRKINGTVSGRHSGLDMAAPTGTPVFAVNDGYIRLAETLMVTGKTIVLDHGMSLYSGYGHLDTLLVEAGDYVKRGQQIGTVGSTGFSTGPHLHFTFTIGTTFVNPENLFGHTLLEAQ